MHPLYKISFIPRILHYEISEWFIDVFKMCKEVRTKRLVKNIEWKRLKTRSSLPLFNSVTVKCFTVNVLRKSAKWLHFSSPWKIPFFYDPCYPLYSAFSFPLIPPLSLSLSPSLSPANFITLCISLYSLSNQMRRICLCVCVCLFVQLHAHVCGCVCVCVCAHGLPVCPANNSLSTLRPLGLKSR